MENKCNGRNVIKESPPIAPRTNINGEVGNNTLDFNSNQNGIDVNSSYKIENQENLTLDTVYDDSSNFHEESTDKYQDVAITADCELDDHTGTCDVNGESCEKAANLSIVSNLDNEQTINDDITNSLTEIHSPDVLSEVANENGLPPLNQGITDSSNSNKDNLEGICFSDDELNDDDDDEIAELSQEPSEDFSPLPDGAIQFSSRNNTPIDEVDNEVDATVESESLTDDSSEKERIEGENRSENSPIAFLPVVVPNPDDDFHSAEYLPNDSSQNTVDITEPEMSTQNPYFECDFGAFDNNSTDSGADDFANFSSAPAHTATEEKSEFTDFASSNQEEDDDFGDFDSNPTWATVTVSPLSCQEKVSLLCMQLLIFPDIMWYKYSQMLMSLSLPTVEIIPYKMGEITRMLKN